MFDPGHLVPRSGDGRSGELYADPYRSERRDDRAVPRTMPYLSDIPRSRSTAALVMRLQATGWILTSLINILVLQGAEFDSAAANDAVSTLTGIVLVFSVVQVTVWFILATYVGRGADGARTATMWLVSIGLIFFAYTLFTGGGGQGIGLFVTLADAALSVTILVNLVRDV